MIPTSRGVLILEESLSVPVVGDPANGWCVSESVALKLPEPNIVSPTSIFAASTVPVEEEAEGVDAILADQLRLASTANGEM